MEKQIRFQDPGEGIHEAEVLEVLVSEGDRVDEGQNILVVETDKASFEISSPYTGVVGEVLVKPGSVIEVGAPIVQLDGSETERQRRSPDETVTAGAAKKKKESKEGEEPMKRRGRPVPASPATRRVARELGVDLEAVEASGEAGRVLEEDVRAHAEAQRRAVRPPEDAGVPREPARPTERGTSLPDFSRWGPVERQPQRSVRRQTARRMAAAWSQIPHVTHQDVADVTELEGFRRRHAARVAERGGKLTLTVLVMKAVVAALREHPCFNASFDPEKEELILKRYYNIGVAIDTKRGLVVPVVRDADRKSISELARDVVRVADAARRGENRREDMVGGTFTLTNVGPLGGTGFTPIINFPEAAILGLARARLHVVVQGTLDEPKIVPRLLLPLALGFDHRIIDGADAARFMSRLIEILRDPEEFSVSV